MDGLQTLSDLMTRCHFREKLFPHDSCTELRDASVELYSIIFEYQARCVYHLSLRSTKRALKDTLETNDWTDMLDKIDKADKKCANLLALFDKSIEHKLQERQAQEIIRQTEMLGDFQRRFLEAEQDKREANLLTSLASDYESDKDIVAARVDGTCEWFFQDDKFHSWRDNECSSLLWISAGPGCGKSVLAKTLIDECRLLSASALHITTCYFFFKDGEEQRTKATNALSAILHQLFDHNPQLIGNALPSSKSFGDKLSNTFSELWKVLIKTAEDESAGHVICVLDALDECEAQSIQMVIDKIIDYYGHRSQHNSSAVLKFLVTSRPYSRVRSAFEHLRGLNEYVHFDGDECSTDISNEINLVIDYRVPRLTQDFEKQDRERISNRLKGMKHRTYLWLHLTLNIIEREQAEYSKASNIETLLSNLPVDVSDAYERILLQSINIKSARTLLQIIIAADGPLTLAEANVALTVATQDTKPRDLDELKLWPEKRFKSTVQDMCGLFVSVHDGKLSLIHQTARQFLVQTVTQESSDVAAESKTWSRCFTIQCADEVLFSICVKYLTMDDFTKQPANWTLRRYYKSASSGAPVFFGYAARRWAFHYKRLPQKERRLLQDQAGALCMPDRNSVSYWFPKNHRPTGYPLDGYSVIHRGSYSDFDRSPIGIASIMGLADVVQCFLAGATTVDHRAEYHRTATRAAIVMDHTDLLRVLCPFNTSARFQLDPRSEVIALQVPRARLSLSTETILQSSTRTRDSDNLSFAVSTHCSLEIIRILLEHGGDPNGQNDQGETLLQSTISHPLRHGFHSDSVRRQEHRVVEQVRLLLEFGADPDMHSNEFVAEPDMRSKAEYPPLQIASGEGCLPLVVSLLLQAGANANLASAAGETPIFLAKRELRRAVKCCYRNGDEAISVTSTTRDIKQAAKKLQLLRDATANEDLEEVTDEEEATQIRSRIDWAHKEISNPRRRRPRRRVQ